MSSKITFLLASPFAGLLLAIPFLRPQFFPLAWVCFIPLFAVLKQTEKRWGAFFLGWLMGMGANLAGFYWLTHTIRVFGGFSLPMTVLVFVVFCILASLSFALFALIVHEYGFGPFNLLPPLFWTAIEFWFPNLFPWYLANSQTTFTTLIQTADLVGPYGTTFLLVWMNACLYQLLYPSKGTKRSLSAAAALGIVVIAVLTYGIWRRQDVNAQMLEAPKLKITAIQGNIDIQYKENIAFLQSNLRSYMELTNNTEPATLVVWPETAVEAWLPENLKQLPSDLLPQLPVQDSHFLFGARSFKGNPQGSNFTVFNSAFLTTSEGKILGRYHKQVLLAFGEYIPFSGVLAKLPGVPPLKGFTPGEGPRTLNMTTGTKIAALICYEDLMPALSRDFVRIAGAGLLINLTNDAWYGDTAAPWQHARLAQWRAIETRRTLVRVTNTGLTSVINAKGELTDHTPLFSASTMTSEVAILRGKTIYVWLGDWWAWLVTLGTFGVILRRLVSRNG